MILLDSLINFGDSYYSSGGINWLDLLVRIATPLISVWLALFLYNKKKREDKEKEDISKKKESDNDLKYFHTIVDDIVNLAEKQIESYDEYATKVKGEPTNNHMLGVVTAENLKRVVTKFDQQKLFHSYISKFKDEDAEKGIKNFRELYNALDIYLMIYDNAIEINIKLIENTTKDHNEYLVYSIGRVIPKIENLNEELKLINPPIQKELEKILNEYRKFEKPTLSEMQNELVVKLLNNALLISTPKFNDLHFDCRVLTSIYEKIVKNSNRQADEILEIKEQLEKLIEGIKDIRQETKKLTEQKKEV